MKWLKMIALVGLIASTQVYAVTPVIVDVNENSLGGKVEIKLETHDNLKFDSIDLMHNESLLGRLTKEQLEMLNTYQLNTEDKKAIIKAVLNNPSIDNTGAFVNFDIGYTYIIDENEEILWESYFSGLGECSKFIWVLEHNGEGKTYINENPPSTLPSGEYEVSLQYRDEFGKNFQRSKRLIVGEVSNNVGDSKGIRERISGIYASFIITNDGELYAYGDNTNNLLGIGKDIKSTYIPTKVKLDGKVEKIAHSDTYTIALTEDGRVFEWGEINETYTREITEIEHLRGQVKDISVGSDFCIVLKKDGTIVGWGTNSMYQLGNTSSGTTYYSNSPVLHRYIEGAVDISASYNHSIALLEDGRIACWGSNSSSDLGNGKHSGNETIDYVKVPEGVQVSKIGTTRVNSYFIDTEGKLYIWGINNNGLTGTGDTSNKSLPTLIEGIEGRVVEVDGEGNCTVVLDDLGNVYAAGNNRNGEIGLGNTTEVHTFTKIADTVGDIESYLQTTVLYFKDGSVKYTGRNSFGVSGNGNDVATKELTEIDTLYKY